MADTSGDDAAVPSIVDAPVVDKKRLAVVESFLAAFVKGAKTMSLYEEGHEMIGQIVARVNNLLRTALGQEPNLTVQVKSKNILYEEAVLEETEEMISFASALHVLGVGQVVFSGKIADEGLLKFMQMITERPDIKRTLVDMQKDVQKTRIDGLQLVSIMSFVETAEDVEQQTPGQLSEEQIVAFLQAKTIPDFTFLLFYQNEPLTGKKADALTILFDEVLDHKISLLEFEKEMPWDLYDPRIRQHWDQLLKGIASRTKWTRDYLYSDLSAMTAEDAVFKEGAKNLNAEAAFECALSEVHSILKTPAGDKQPKYALFAYTRMLSEMGRRGDLDGVLKEMDLWREMAVDQKWAAYLAALKKEVQTRVPTPALAKKFVEKLQAISSENPKFQGLVDFVLTVGRGFVPMLLEEMRSLSDKGHRQKLCALLAAVCRILGPEDLFADLEDEDYFHIVLVLGILTEINMPRSAVRVAPLLKHEHVKVRKAVFQALRRFGGEESVLAMTEFIVTHKEEDEVKLGVTSLSLINHSLVATKLVEACMIKEDYGVRVAIVTALGRFGSQDTLNYLKSLDHWGLFEWLTGKNKELRNAVRASIQQVQKELADGA